MDIQSPLTPTELASLRQVSRGIFQDAISATDTERLLHLKLIYILLGDLRITAAGKARLLFGA
jgi:hypothetical protein